MPVPFQWRARQFAARRLYYGHGYRGLAYGGLYAFGGPAYYGYDDSCWVRRSVPTPYGLRWRLVDVCD